MSSAKQWVSNKVNPVKRGSLKPFDGFLYTENNSVYFKFSSPGLIGGKIPNNMWTDVNNLFSASVSGVSKWYVVANCNFQNGVISSITLSVVTDEPSPPDPVKSGLPSSMSIILWTGFGKANAYKMFDGNINIKSVIVQRSYKTSVECGVSNYEDWYTLAAVL